MKLSNLNLLLGYYVATASSACIPETTVPVDAGNTKLSVSGYVVDSITRYTSAVPGSKIVLSGYESEPIVMTSSDGIVEITAGDPCDETEVQSESSAISVLKSMTPLLMAPVGIISPLTAIASYVILGSSFVSAMECSDSITIEIYQDVNELIHEGVKSLECPPESFYYEHHPTVYGGYSGCVGEKYLLPCAQDAQGADDSGLYSKTPINWDGEKCVETGYDYETRSFWILWGDPLDKHEMMLRTGFQPTVTFPLTRGPYPAYSHGTDETSGALDDSASAKAYAKDFLVYIGAMKESDKSDWYVGMTEGAEQGIEILWAAKALEIAQTTCNRDIYVLMEAPAYGYSNGEMAMWVNNKASTFYNSTECLCFADDSCKKGTVTINNVGFFPKNIPSRLGGDNITYSATSTSPSSPWFESMVFPENPSGRIKVPQIPDPNRRVCDGVYVWPMYFYFNEFEIPYDKIPDCSAWAYATTKGYSASVRSGFITYKKEPEVFVKAVGTMLDTTDSMGNGLLSEWTYMGQMQIQEMMMSRPLSDPTSWVGAYSGIMKEKWDAVTEGFADCPVLELTNSRKGAYAFFLYKEPYLGLQTSFISSFFLNVLGVKATTYYWGFRGADPSEFYGEGVGSYDFTRLQLYRDLNVYEEVARRAKIVCADTSASIGDFISIDDWQASAIARTEGRRLREAMPHLTEKQHRILDENEKMYEEMHQKSEACAPDYTMTCLFKSVGRRFEDVDH